jgi:phosphocarrier protein HPr
MIEKKFVVLNEDGLHARPAGVLAKNASLFQSAVELRVNGVTKSAKSIMGIMSLGLEKGAEVTIVANGPDEGAAIESLMALALQGFQTSGTSAHV